MPTNTNDPRRRPPARPATQAPGSEPGRRPARRPTFGKDGATLWLLTIALGLGIGAAARFVQRAEPSQASGTGVATLGGATAQSSQPLPFESQRVAVLPQQSYRSRAVTRMS